jgi:uncharacterized cofD-like protein
MHIKRWLALMLVGVACLALGIAYVLVEVYRSTPLPEFTYYLTLQFWPRPVRGVLFFGLGIGATVYGFLRLNKTILTTVSPQGYTNWVDTLYRRMQLGRGPRVVAIGGGTGLSTLLRGLKEHTSNITAIVTVADDGGSSGRIREQLKLLPPGDIRQCIAALADAEPLVTQLFQYRFEKGSDLEGHSFGNLFIAAMAGVTGSFERAVQESSRVLAVRGRILPSTLEDVTLWAELADNTTVAGESRIPASGCPIKRVFLSPAGVAAYPEAVQAILTADLVVVGPGSLYTSILPNLLVKDIARALMVTSAPVVYVANIATQPGETLGYYLQDHVKAICEHVGFEPFDYVLVNNSAPRPMPAEWRIDYVLPESGTSFIFGAEVVTADLISEDRLTRHDPAKLGAAVMQIASRGPRPARERTPGTPAPVA